MKPSTDTTLWQAYRTTLADGSAYQSALTVLELEPDNPVLRELQRRVRDGHYGEPKLDWERWIDEVEAEGRGWSSSEWRLYDVAAALAVNRPLSLRGTFDRMGSHLEPVLNIIHRWGIENY